MIHIHVSFGTPLGTCYMTKSGTYKHQGTFAIGKGANGSGSTFDFAVQSLDGVVGANSTPMLRWEIHVGQCFFDAILYLWKCR